MSLTRMSRPRPPVRRPTSRAAKAPPRALSVAMKALNSSPWRAELKMTVGMPARRASATGRIRARSSTGERTMASIPAPARVSTIWICSFRSSSLRGPFQTISTPISFAAARAPAWTDFQNSWVVPIGMTAILRRRPPGPPSFADGLQPGRARPARMSMRETARGASREGRDRRREAIGLLDLGELSLEVEGSLGPEILAGFPERQGPGRGAPVAGLIEGVPGDDRHVPALTPIGLEPWVAVVGIATDEDERP